MDSKTILNTHLSDKLNTSNPHNYHYKAKHLEVRVLGGLRMHKTDSMRITLAISKAASLRATAKGGDEATSNADGAYRSLALRHTLDLYNDTQVEKFVRKIAERLEIGTSVTRRTLQELTQALENHRFACLQQEQQNDKVGLKPLTATQEAEAIKFLKSQKLLEKTNALIGKSGVIGEDTNRLLMYLIFTSRLTEHPLHCISLGSSGVGKTHLQSKVAELIPQQDKKEITVLSANAFYYFNRTELRNKLILIEDLDGAESVLYPLRELQSKKRITKTVVHKDKTGSPRTIDLVVEGPVSVAGCTTKESVYEDNSNRSFLLYIDESPEQDNRIMDYQRARAAGSINQESERTAAELLRNVQQVLKPVKVINPYAAHLSLPQSVFKPRRTNTHYLQLIEAITFYHQHQREQHTNKDTGEIHIETTVADIQAANSLITEVLLRKSDTLTGACRNYLENLKSYLLKSKQTQYTNAEIRRNLRVKESTLRNYHHQLLMEAYIRKVTSKGKTRDKSYRFEIINMGEYKQLEAHIKTALERALNSVEATPPLGLAPVADRATSQPPRK